MPLPQITMFRSFDQIWQNKNLSAYPVQLYQPVKGATLQRLNKAKLNFKGSKSCQYDIDFDRIR